MAEYLDTFIKEFEAANPDVKVENISVNEEASYNNKFKTLVATGDIPNIFYLPGIASLVKYAQNGLIMDVSELFQDKEWYDGFVDGAFDMFNFEPYGVKGVYAIPFAVTPEVIFYNVDLLKSVGYDTFPGDHGRLLHNDGQAGRQGHRPVRARCQGNLAYRPLPQSVPLPLVRRSHGDGSGRS